jgi:hypothetical protein
VPHASVPSSMAAPIAFIVFMMHFSHLTFALFD